MGWEKFLLVAGQIGADYLNKKGIDGAMEDANKIKEGVQKLFMSKNKHASEEDDEIYLDDWNQTLENIKSNVVSGNFENAYSELQGFYDRHNEGQDFWYNYWSTLIGERLWESLWLENVIDDEKRVVKLSKDINSLQSEIEEALNDLLTSADGEEENEAAQQLSDYFQNQVAQQEQTLFHNEVWTKIDRLLDPHKIVSGSKYFDYTNAANRLASQLYSYDEHNSIDYARDLSKVYDAMLHAALQDDTLLSDVKIHFKDVKYKIDSLDSTLRNIETDDGEEKEEAIKLANKMNSLLGKVTEKINQPEPESKSSIDITTAKQKETVNNKNENDYLEEVRACLEDDGEISQRERRLLNRLRDSLNITEQRALELETTLSTQLSDDEKEYIEAFKESIVDGKISQRERRLLDKLRKSMGISEERAKELETHAS